jgi:hypothetical protein
MAYVVKPLLEEGRSQVLDALRNGDAIRWGGSLRVPKGMPGAGQFVAHLRDFSKVAEATTQVPSALSSLLQLTNVGAVASVLNLGVSAVGFAVMAKKLNRLQASVDFVLAKQDALHDLTSAGFQEVNSRLVELRVLALEGNEKLSEAILYLKELRRDLLDGYAARVQADIHTVHRTSQPSSSTLESSRRSLDEARRWLESGIDRDEAALDVTGLFDGLVRYRIWCVTSVVEVDVLRRAGARQEAAELARSSAKRSRRLASAWARKLLPPDEHDGALMFEHRAFARIPKEVKCRLYELQEGTRSPEDFFARSTQAALSVADRAPSPQWFARREAIAGTLDFLEEATERLESSAAEMEYCETMRLSYQQWEALPLPEGSAAPIGILEVAA